MNKNELIEKAVIDFGGKWIFPFKNLCTPAETNTAYAPHSTFESIRNVSELGPNWLFVCTEEEFNAAADRMRGKPDWKDAPVWAQWLAQDTSGDWHWYPRQENPPKQSTFGFVNKSAHRLKNACSGKVIGDWRNTLEKRPEQSIYLEAERFGIMPPVNKNEGCSMAVPTKPWFEVGELPPVGSTEIDCKIKGKAYEQIKAFKVLAHENGKAVIASYHNEREHWAEIGSYHKRPVNFTPYVISKPYFLPIEPIKTGKEKAIEAAIDVLVEFPSAVAHVGWIGKLYDAGLLRLPDQK